MKMRENKKGFSLVELIIVMAIMVALIAVLAPQFVKYVQRARDSSVADAADNAFQVAKSEYALGNLKGAGVITVACGEDKTGGVITITLGDGLTYSDATDSAATFQNVCGIDSKEVQSKQYYEITVGGTATAPTFNISDAKTAA